MPAQLSLLDPKNSTDVEALRGALRQRRGTYPPDLLALARRTHDESADPTLRLDALNVLASAAVVSGDDDEGCRLFRRALDATWGSGSHAERVACINLAMILTRQRRLVEAFALARRACRIALDSNERLAICLSHVQLGKALLELGDAEGFERAVAVAVRHRPECDETLRGWIPHLLAGMQAEVAYQNGDFAGADRFMDAAFDGPDVLPEVVAMMRATHLRRVGRADDALRVIRAAVAAGPEEPCYRLRFQAEELLCLVDLGDRASVYERAAGCLAEMVRDGRNCGTPTWRMRVGVAVGAALAGDESTRGAARQALEIAAVAALERSWESRLFFQEFPQLERMEPGDVAVLEAHGERFRAKHLELMAAMRSLLREGARYETPLAANDGDEFFASVCAWCNRVRGPERVWIPLDQYQVTTTDIDVTHGICETCTTGLVAGSGSPRAAAPERVAAASAARA